MTLCMTTVEEALWETANVQLGSRAPSPCTDCTAEFHALMLASGRCDGTPGPTVGRPMLETARVVFTGRHGQAKKYATDSERIAARRLQWREYQRRKRAA